MNTRHGLSVLGKLMFTLAVVLLIGSSYQLNAQGYLNQITFDNRSGNNAVVKLVGPSGVVVHVPSNQGRTVNVAPGTYVILVRYGDDAGSYSYSKGRAFSVEQVGNMYSVITITLHPVLGGNYETRPISAAEFNGQ
jgi:hypothetical protein